MKRYIRASYTGDPPASELGQAMTEYHKTLKSKYSPFEVSATHWSRFSTVPTGYRIILKDSDESGSYVKEWVAQYTDSMSKEVALFGPSVDETLTSRNFKDYEKQGIFDSLDDAIDYLQTNA